MTLVDTINRAFREFYRYTGDGLPNEPASAPLPVGDPESGVSNPKKAELREALTEVVSDVDTWAAEAEAARNLAIAAADTASAVGGSAVPNYATVTAATAATIPAARTYVLVAGYAVAGDAGRNFQYKRVATQPTHGAKFRSVDRFLPGGAVDAGNGGWWELAESIIDPRMIGADPTGVANSAAAIQAAINCLPASGGTVAFSGGIYAVGSTITIGNGTSSARSSRVGVKLCGTAGGGVGEGEFGTPNAGVIIKYTGSSGAFTPVIQLTGPIHSCVLEDLVIDCNNLAGRGVTAIHPYQCRFVNVQVEKWSNVGFYLTSHNTMPAAVTQGIMDNLLIQCQARTPNGTAGQGFLLEGFDHASAFVPCSRNVLIQCHALIPGAFGSAGLKLVFADNNHIDRFTANWASATVAGHGLILNGSTAHPGLCVENQFSNCTLVGGYSLTGGTNGYNLFVGYNTSDGSPLPIYGSNLRFLLPDGRMIGGFAGSAVYWSGGATALAVGYYFAVGASGAGSTSVGNIMPGGGRVSRFYVALDVPPGASASRTIRLRAGSTNLGSVTYGPGESGTKTVVINSDVLAGIKLNVASETSGAPVASDASWGICLYPLEAV